jgi:GGDEF domain-containing protein
MYTDAMRRAFHSITPPKNFGITLMDADNFIRIRLSEKTFIHMTHDEKLEAVKYVSMVKKALEMEGAIVLVVREPLK